MAKALQAMGKKCDLLLECVCTGNAAQAEIEKSGFLHYAAAQPEPIVAVGALLARLAEKLDEYGQSFWEICPEKKILQQNCVVFIPWQSFRSGCGDFCAG